jgi:hypothetical protein
LRVLRFYTYFSLQTSLLRLLQLYKIFVGSTACACHVAAAGYALLLILCAPAQYRGMVAVRRILRPALP